MGDIPKTPEVGPNGPELTPEEQKKVDESFRMLMEWKGPEPDQPCDDLTCRSCYVQEGSLDDLFFR